MKTSIAHSVVYNVRQEITCLVSIRHVLTKLLFGLIISKFALSINF
jgi:hypothetical protein